MMMFLMALLAQDVSKDAAAAIRETAKKNFAFAGEMKLKSDDMDEIVAPVSGAVAAPFEVVVKSKGERSTHEIFHRAGKTIERTTYRGYPDPVLGTDELLSILDLAKLADAAAKGTAGKRDADGSLRITLGEDAIRTYQDEPIDMGMKVDSVALTLWIKDGIVEKLEAAVERTFDDGGDSFSQTAIYTLTLSKRGEARVEIPEEIRKELGE